ncbi:MULTISPECIES: SDR family NAD(P)-dependent oxidoreductase [Paenibacillus]|uniref:SDR family NAD(P)-dependent oxidoreductase n=1 Tax=Paenibacillus TaxID=44249 RepID=UPI002FDFE029
MENPFDLTGKVAVVTGGSGGIGFEIARVFAVQGADVALLDKKADHLEAQAGKIRDCGRKAISVPCDVTKEEEVREAVNRVLDTFSKIDILVNNAGVAGAGSVDQLEESEWDAVVDPNLKGIYLMSKHVVKYMKQRKYGKIINMASVCGLVGSKAVPLHAYSASKGAVVNLTRAMGASYAQDGITVNAIGPSLFRTEMTEAALYKGDFLKMYNNLCPMGRPGNPEELNGAALYFASDASSYTTGQTLFVDGGWSAV